MSGHAGRKKRSGPPPGPRGPQRLNPEALRNPYQLTTGELELVPHILAGLSHTQMAHALYVHRHTVAYRADRIMEKMGCKNLTEVAVQWVREQEHFRELGDLTEDEMLARAVDLMGLLIERRNEPEERAA